MTEALALIKLAGVATIWSILLLIEYKYIGPIAADMKSISETAVILESSVMGFTVNVTVEGLEIEEFLFGVIT